MDAQPTNDNVTAESHKWRIKKHRDRSRICQWISFILLRMLTGFIQILPLRLAVFFVKSMASLVYYIDFLHSRRAVAHVLYSGICTTPKEARALARASFISVGMTFVEIVKARQLINKDNFREYFTLEASDETIKRHFAGEDGENAIIVSAHVGNWELAGMAYCLFSGKKLVSIMRPLNNQLIGDYFYSHRESDMHTTVAKDSGLLSLFKSLLSGQSIAVVADQHASSREGVEISFMGKRARAHKSPSLLSIRGRRPILCGALIRLDEQMHFKLVVSDPIDFKPSGDLEADVKSLTQLYSDKLAEIIQRYPEQWLWSHRRWLDCNRANRVHKHHKNP